MSVKRLINDFNPEHYELLLDLSQADKRSFTGKAQIFGTVKNEKEIFLHAKDLKIEEIVFLDDKKVTFSKNGDEIKIGIDQFNFNQDDEISFKICFSGKITDAMHGLYPCYYKENGVKKELFATQFESHHAREVFPCIDEPEAKATFSLGIVSQKIIVKLLNLKKLHGCQHIF